jgi:hypothetical protein
LHLNRKVEVHRRVLYLHHQNLPYRVLRWHRPLVIHVLLELQIHKKLRISLAIDKVLHDDVVRPLGEVLCGDGLDLHGEVEVGHVLEGDGWHADLVLFGRNLDHGRVLVDLIKFFQAGDFGHLAIDSDWQA